MKFPKYAEPGGFKEIDAREFEAENALSRAQIYESATTALVHEKGAAWASATEGGALTTETVGGFLAALAHASHTRADAQFRSFDDAFVDKVTEGLPPAMRGVWARLRPLIRRSRFSLLAWEPTVLGDAYLCAPGLSKSRLAVLPVHLPHPCIVRACSLKMSRAQGACDGYTSLAHRAPLPTLGSSTSPSRSTTRRSTS